jgi:hypothetical protein
VAHTRFFEGLDAFAKFIEERPLVIIPTGALVKAGARKVLEQNVRDGYGKHSLAELAQATQDDRVSKGYSPDDPLLRDGSLLRDSTEGEIGPEFVAVHTAEPIAGYHEFGYYNVRAGHDVPARPVYKEALEKTLPTVEELIEEALGVQLGFETSLSSDVESQTTRYSASEE